MLIFLNWDFTSKIIFLRKWNSGQAKAHLAKSYYDILRSYKLMFSKNSNKHGKRVIACYKKKNNTHSMYCTICKHVYIPTRKKYHKTLAVIIHGEWIRESFTFFFVLPYFPKFPWQTHVILKSEKMRYFFYRR